MSVIHLISAAGGLEKSATGSSITILRDEDGSQTRFRFNYRELISGQNLQQNIVLKPGDTVIVPE